MSKSYIEKLASIIHNYIFGTNTSTPIDSSNVIEKKLGIDIYFGDINQKGVLEVNNHCPKMVISNALNYYQQNYIIAKLVGYLVLNWKFTPNKRLSNTLYPITC